MRHFKAPDDHPTPYLDFVSPEGRAAIRAALAKNAPDIMAACGAHGEMNAAEQRDRVQYLVDLKAENDARSRADEPLPALEPESEEDWLLTDRYWHGEHRVPPRAKQTVFDLSTPEGRNQARNYLEHLTEDA